MARGNLGTVEEIMQRINKDAKEELIVKGLPSYDYEKIPFTSPYMNYITYGGLPLGRLVEFYGEEGGGKTTTALDVVANFQNEYPDKKVLYVDAENTLDTKWAMKLGVDISNIYLYQPKIQSAEEVFQLIVDMVDTGEIGLWVLDSLPCLTSKSDLEKQLTDDARVAGISGALTRFCRMVVGPCAKHNCMGIGINQVRDKIGSTIPGLLSTPGGRAWKHFCTNRIEFKKGTYMDETGNSLSRSSGSPDSQLIMVNMIKTKSCPPTRHVGQYTINYEIGIDYLKDVIDIGMTLGYINRKSGWYEFVNVDTGEILGEKIQGQTRVKQYLEEHEDILQMIEAGIDKVINEP